MGVFGNVTPCSLVKNLQFCGEAGCLHLKVAGFSETSHLYRVSGSKFPQGGVPYFNADCHLSIHSCIRVSSRRNSETAKINLRYPKLEKY